MRAVRLTTGSLLHPFGDAVGEVLVGNRRLEDLQREALTFAGIELVASPPSGEPFLVFSDRCWFTPRLARALARAAEAGRTGRFTWTNKDLIRDAGPFQADPGRPELSIQPAGGGVSLDGPDLSLELVFHALPGTEAHPAWAHVQRGPLAIGSALAHGIHHWSDLLRANLLSLAARAEEAREDWETGGLGARLELVGGVLWRAGGLTRARIARGLGHEGKRCKIHPTAIVEACELGDDVEIGPFAIVRGSVLGDRVKVDPYVTLGLSVVGEGARVGRAAMINLSVVYPGAFVSEGGGWQMCVVGRDAFCAKTATVLDLSFGNTIRSPMDGVKADTEVYFLGAAIGHRARIGAGVRICYGASVPNDVLLVAPADTLFRTFPEGLTGALTVRDGVAVPVQSRPVVR